MWLALLRQMYDLTIIGKSSYFSLFLTVWLFDVYRCMVSSSVTAFIYSRYCKILPLKD